MSAPRSIGPFRRGVHHEHVELAGPDCLADVALQWRPPRVLALEHVPDRRRGRGRCSAPHRVQVAVVRQQDVPVEFLQRLDQRSPPARRGFWATAGSANTPGPGTARCPLGTGPTAAPRPAALARKGPRRRRVPASPASAASAARLRCLPPCLSSPCIRPAAVQAERPEADPIASTRTPAAGRCRSRPCAAANHDAPISPATIRT